MEFATAARLDKLPPYLFAALRKKIAARKADGKDVISLGIGDPDRPAPDPVVEELRRAAADPEDANRHRYGCDVPYEGFPEAVAGYYRRRYGVELGEDAIVATMGSKDAIVKLSLALLDPGDMIIAPDPGYPTYNIGAVFSSAVTWRLPLRAENARLPDFDEIPREVKRLAKIMWLCYPHNPTTALADLDFYRRAVDFCRENEILLCSDAAYIENVYDGYRAPSVMEVDGAEETAVEFFSLSKAFNMTGWRLGSVVGNASAVAALDRVKNNIDNGSLRALQFAAAKALDTVDEIVPPINDVYRKRRDMVVAALRDNGWEVDAPKATIYVWAPVPEKYDGSSAAFAEDLLDRAGVVVTPGAGFGEYGEGFYRISLSYPDEVLAAAMDRIREIGG